MSILSDIEIREAIERQTIDFTPMIEPDQIGPASVDLHLGSSFAYFRPETKEPIFPGKTSMVERMRYEERQSIIIAPGDFLLASTQERVTLGHAMVARVEGRSSFGRMGLTVHSTAGFIDPGFDGEVTLEITNEGPLPIHLTAGLRVCQLVFERCGKPAQRPYGSEGRPSKYQGQMGATPSRLRGDSQ